MKLKRFLCLALVLIGGLFGICICWLILPEEHVSRAKFASPANSKHQIWFYEDRFKGRDFKFYVKPDGQELIFITHLSDVGKIGESIGQWTFGFSHAQWTKDGHAVVCFFHKAIGDTPTMGFGYDFGTINMIAPERFFSMSHKGERREFEPTIQKFVASHGGLSDQRIDVDLIRKYEKNLRFWQTPP